MQNISTDHIVARWATRKGFPWRLTPIESGNGSEIAVSLSRVCARFQDGKLVRIETHVDGDYNDALAVELAELFALCGYIELLRGGGAESEIHDLIAARGTPKPAESATKLKPRMKPAGASTC